MKILTIDFDIIMGPSIEQYNNDISDINPIDNLFNCDSYVANLYIYQQLTLFLLNLIQTLPPEKIIFIMDHEEVLTCLQDISEPIDLINIDHHHDLGYKNKAYELNLTSCSNWVKLLCERQLVNSYVWINNDTTMCYPFETELKYLTENINIQTVIQHLNMINDIDMIIICASFNWVPPQYRNLFFLWKDLIESYYQKKIVLIDKSNNFIENN